MEEFNEEQNYILEYLYKKVLVSVNKINSAKGSKTIHPKDYFTFTAVAFNNGNLPVYNVRHYLSIDDHDVGMLITPRIEIYNTRVGASNSSLQLQRGKPVEEMFLHATEKHKIAYKIKHLHAVTFMMYDEIAPGGCSIIFIYGIANNPGKALIKYRIIADVNAKILPLEKQVSAFAENSLIVVKKL